MLTFICGCASVFMAVFCALHHRETELVGAEQHQQAGKPAWAVLSGVQGGVEKDKEKTAVQKEAMERTHNAAFTLCQ